MKTIKNCLEATHLKNKIKHLEKNKYDIYSLKKNHREFIGNNKSILKTQQRFKNEMHYVFTEKLIRQKKKKNAINWFDKNIRILNNWRSNKWKRRD